MTEVRTMHFLSTAAKCASWQVKIFFPWVYGSSYVKILVLGVICERLRLYNCRGIL